MFFHPRPRIAAAALTTLLATACISEDIALDRVDVNGGNEDRENEIAGYGCALVDDMLVADLPRSDATPANAYVDSTFEAWCERNIVADDLENFVGNAAAWTADETDPLVTATSPTGRATRPRLAHGARLELHVLEPRGTIPFVRKIHFTDWQGPEGACALEMRVYQQDIGETGKKPLLYFHGGGWRNRTTTMTAAEVLITQLVDEHVVFMPAYPLHGDKDGPAECRNARFEDILAAAQEAFDWVVAHKDVFGATGAAAIDVMGHSAGGQLAAWIATQNRARVDKLVNFYGPVEFAAFIDETDPGGEYEDTFGGSKKLLASLLRVDTLASMQRPYPEIVTANSLAEIIAAEGAGAVPPFFMVQGNADTTVPVAQALHACNALGGSASEDGGLHACPNDSMVGIVDGAGHNLDRRCIAGEWPLAGDADAENLMDVICPNRDADYDKVQAVVSAAFEWLDK